MAVDRATRRPHLPAVRFAHSVTPRGVFCARCGDQLAEDEIAYAEHVVGCAHALPEEVTDAAGWLTERGTPPPPPEPQPYYDSWLERLQAMDTADLGGVSEARRRIMRHCRACGHLHSVEQQFEGGFVCLACGKYQ